MTSARAMHLLVSVRFDVLFCRLCCMVCGMGMMTMCYVRVMCCFLMVSRLVMFRGFLMMPGCVLVVLSSVMVVFACFFRHGIWDPFLRFQTAARSLSIPISIFVECTMNP